MLLCLACYGPRLASVLDSAPELVLFRVEDGRAEPAGSLPGPGGDASALGRALGERGVDALVCGAATGCCLAGLRAAGIAVRPWIGGTAEDVIRAWLDGRLDDLSLPGCRRRSRECPGCCRARRKRHEGCRQLPGTGSGQSR